jgi:hypothetical protein
MMQSVCILFATPSTGLARTLSPFTYSEGPGDLFGSGVQAARPSERLNSRETVEWRRAGHVWEGRVVYAAQLRPGRWASV